MFLSIVHACCLARMHYQVIWPMCDHIFVSSVRDQLKLMTQFISVFCHHKMPLVSGVDIEVQLFDKMSTRLPEALMLHFTPNPLPQYKFLLSKLGQLVNPTNVILNGSQYQHGKNNQTYFY